MRAPVVTVAAAVVAVTGALTSVVVASAASSDVPADEVAILLAVSTYALVGVVIDRAQPGHLVARLMAVGATGWGAGEGLLALGLQGYLHDPGSVPAAGLLAVVGTALRGLGWLVLILAVPLVFPDGGLPWPGRKWPGRLLVAAVAAFTAATLLAPRPLESRLEEMDSPTGLPLELLPLTDALAMGALVLCVVVLAVAVAGLVHRWRSGGELRRQQLLWLCVAFALPLLFLPLIGTDLVAPWMFAVVVIPVPVAAAVAMLQRRLYDVQLALSRTLTWLLLSAVVATLYALTVAGVGALLSQRGAVWLPWLAAGVVAVCFAPLHRVLQQGVNRLTYGGWSQPAEVLAATGRRLVDASDVPALLQQLVGELTVGLGLERVEILDHGGRVLAAQGPPGHHVESVPLTAYGAPVGVLGWRGRALRPADRRLLEDLSHQLGGVVHSEGLLDRVREAGHRLVLAREEERRRLRRDLHDGLGPQLAGLTLQVDTLRNRLSSGVVPAGADADRELVALRTEIQSTVGEVRRIVEGLRPPALDELGLSGALEQVVRRTTRPPLTVHCHVAALPSVPAAVEVACYRIAQEALTNVVRHSGAGVATVCLRADDGMLLLEVTDDGSGTVLAREDGVGLTSMRERAEQIGGRLVIGSTPGAGTSVQAWLPVEPVRAVLPSRSSSVDGATR